MKRIAISLFLFGLLGTTVAQQVVDVCGEYTYYPSADISLAQAKQTALQRARTAALVEKFDETVFQSNTTFVSNRDGESNIDFYSLGGTEARGVWIEDNGQPQYQIMYEQDQLVVKVSVCGKARATASAAVAVDARVLRNGTTVRHQSSDFVSGDDMFLYFRSPVAGHLAVYLLDRASQQVFCLLPYRSSESGAVQVAGDKEYVFFQRDRQLPDWQNIDEYTLTAESPVEWNDIYIVFSPNAFYKAAAAVSDNELIPRELSFAKFNEWLVRCMTKDPDMVVEKRQVKITKQ
ncbi:MAG: DUF4384 domain-containing protein [Bacteroidales bacterium]|nr:DUF4384 domain-containing protein [Bacteroidales bacterium]